MDSINNNQAEHNRSDLTDREAVERIRDIVESAKGSCFFCTHAEGGLSNGTRPMSVQKVDDDGNLWFLSAVDSNKNAELQRDPSVELFIQGSPHSGFLHLRGHGTITTERGVIDELWEPIAKVWFTEGKDDPRITAIKVAPSDGYYWDNKHGDAVAGIKMLVGAATGRTMDDSIEGTVRV
ncbi:MAG: pyridoxamine 5'-phosphate oxidase family protein [Gemmatimonadaceae bacterium]|nr:pyridoxamine 5'-phosphate oxidase family protein [Gemmatimonadaceae bacterium]